MTVAIPVWHGADALAGSLVLITELEPWPDNPRRGDVAAVAASLRRFGQVRAVVVQGARIVAGHHVVLAARELGWSHVAVLDHEFASEQEARAFLLADNRTAELGSVDEQLLAAQLREFDEAALLGTGYDAAFVANLRRELAIAADLDVLAAADADDVPAVPVKPVSKPGEVYEVGAHRLMCGDSTNPEHVATLMDGERATLLFTSPPYLDARDYGGKLDLSVEHVASFLPVYADYADLFAVNLGLTFRDGAVVRYWDHYIAAAERAGLKMLGWNIWDRGEGGTIGRERAMFPLHHEFVFVFGEQRRQLRRTVPNKRAGGRTGHAVRQRDGSIRQSGGPGVIQARKPLPSVFACAPVKGMQGGGGDHPAMFPVPFASAYVAACTEPGDVIVDPFGGAGTTLMAAETLGRRAFVMEVNPGYADIARARYEQLRSPPRHAS